MSQGKRRLNLALIGTVIATAILCFIVPQLVVVVYFLLIFIIIIYVFVKVIQSITLPSEREKLKDLIRGE